jgi:hypothetical protein
VLKKAHIPYILACHLQIDADLDPVPDPAYLFYADPYPGVYLMWIRIPDQQHSRTQLKMDLIRIQSASIPNCLKLFVPFIILGNETDYEFRSSWLLPVLRDNIREGEEKSNSPPWLLIIRILRKLCEEIYFSELKF